MIGIPIKRPRSIGIRSIGPDGPNRKPQLPMEGRRPFVGVGLPLFSEDFTVLRFQGSEIPEPRFQQITPYPKKRDPRHQSPANTGKGALNRQKPEETVPPYTKKSRIASKTGDDTETGASNHQKQHEPYPIREKPDSSHQTPVSAAKGANTTQKTAVRTNRATVLMLQIPALSSESSDLTEPGYERSCH